MTSYPAEDDRHPLSTVGITNEQIHPMVGYRADLHKTKPDALRYKLKALTGWTRRPCMSGPGFEYYKGSLVIPEFKIAWKTDHRNLERLAVHPDAEPYVKDEDFE